MNKALNEMIQQDAEKHVVGIQKSDPLQGSYRFASFIAGATSMVEKMEGFTEWIDRHGWIKAMAGY